MESNFNYNLSDLNDKDIIATACVIWANYIETYCVSQSAEDARERIYPAKNHYEPNLLDNKQKRLVARLHELAEEYRS